MVAKNKKGPALDPEQHRLVEHAQRRIRQKKQLYTHLVVYLVGGVFLVALNKVLKYGEAYDWSYWVLLGWGFILLLHVVNVFITKRLLGPEWERAERDRLVRKQQQRIAKMEEKIREEYPLPDKAIPRKAGQPPAPAEIPDSKGKQPATERQPSSKKQSAHGTPSPSQKKSRE